MESPGDRLRAARSKLFTSIAKAAEAKGFHKQNLADHEADRRGISPEQAEDYAKAFKVAAEWILFGKGGPKLNVVGYVGAGSEVYMVDDYPMGDGMKDFQPTASVPVGSVGLEIRGSSMYPYRDGDVLIYSARTPDVEAFVGGRECIVWLADDRVLFKSVSRGSHPGLYNLTSLNFPTIEDVVIDYCAKIEAVEYR